MIENETYVTANRGRDWVASIARLSLSKDKAWAATRHEAELAWRKAIPEAAAPGRALWSRHHALFRVLRLVGHALLALLLITLLIHFAGVCVKNFMLKRL